MLVCTLSIQHDIFTRLQHRVPGLTSFKLQRLNWVLRAGKRKASPAGLSSQDKPVSLLTDENSMSRRQHSVFSVFLSLPRHGRVVRRDCQRNSFIESDLSAGMATGTPKEVAKGSMLHVMVVFQVKIVLMLPFLSDDQFTLRSDELDVMSK